LLVLAVFVLPALDLLGSARPVAPALPTRPSYLGRRFAALLERLVSGCARVGAWLATGGRPWAVIGVVCGLFGLVALLFGSGQIESRTRALEFLRGTSVERQARALNQPGNLGFEFLDLLVEPAGAGDLYDPRFLARAWAYQDRLRRIPEARETASILSTVHQIAQASFKKPFPETRDEIDAAFVLIESRLAPAVQRQLYFSGGVRISVSYGFDNSVELGHFCDRILALAHQEFPDLKVSAFNKVPLYPRVDHYVRQGKIVNVFSSQLGVALICGLVIAWRNRGRTGAWLSPVRGGLVMSAPLFFATTVIGIIMWVLDIPLDMATAPISALAINAATDFSLYLALAYQDALAGRSPEDALGEALRREGKIILTDCLLNTICFLPLITSRFLPIADIGWMMGLMLVACAVGTLVIMAALLPRCVVRAEGAI
jgi:predicted RND superfamily exporter protein